MSEAIDQERLLRAYRTARDDLLGERASMGHWVGELSSSALSTATAVSALASVAPHVSDDTQRLATAGPLIARGLEHLAARQNPDGGWGDTDKSLSNISTTMLVRAAVHLAGAADRHADLLARADRYIDAQGNIDGLRRRYGKDRTFAVPILTNCALAGLVGWQEVAPLPFELACTPYPVLRFLRLPVVSYAVPALVAVGQAVYFHRKPRNPITRLVRRLAVGRSLETLARMQPDSGGFLEATPLTSFVVMSLASIGRVRHPVVRRGVEFLVASVLPDGSWPIDTNLATWVTTLSLGALAAGGEEVGRLGCLDWVLGCQHRKVHPFTSAAAGGWGWSDLSGAVPDADDTAGALLALAAIRRSLSGEQEGSGFRVQGSGAGVQGSGAGVQGSGAGVQGSGFRVQGSDGSGQTAAGGSDGPTDADTNTLNPEPRTLNPEPCTLNPAEQIDSAASAGIRWLLDLQNGDGGWPTFCRGWGALPFDRSGVDLTAHAIRALAAWKGVPGVWAETISRDQAESAIRRGLKHLAVGQSADGSWSPLWFGNQYRKREENPVYGTGRVLLAYRDLQLLDTGPARRGLSFLAGDQNADGGWGGGNSPSGSGAAEVSSVEETAVALEALLAARGEPSLQPSIDAALAWLVRAVESGGHRETRPIGLYFAKLWYYERLYPLVFSVAALGAAIGRGTPPQAERETSRPLRG